MRPEKRLVGNQAIRQIKPRGVVRANDASPEAPPHFNFLEDRSELRKGEISLT